MNHPDISFRGLAWIAAHNHSRVGLEMPRVPRQRHLSARHFGIVSGVLNIPKSPLAHLMPFS
ncbi:hypothetical protein [Caballeronia sordidicola]|uniref:hypothetical protein n=1 Tax=Caballeronia sordidicola TaxID=196367 RepID=UPI0015C5C3C7|nr:hypothetical protein [Caballeronia sordidicola]